MTSFADPLSGISYTIKDHGFTDALSKAPGVVAYFGARALGMMFAKHRKEVKARAPTPGLAKLIKRFTKYEGYPPGSKEHILLDKNEPGEFNKIFQRFVTSVPAVLAHETGATIRPKNSKYLLIPSRKLVGKGRGTGRAGRAKIEALGKGETFVKRGKRGAFLYSRLSDGKAMLLGLLRTSVTLKPQLGLVKAWNVLAGYREMRVNWALTQITQFLAGLPGEDPRVNRLIPKTDTSRLLSQALGGKVA